MPLARNIESHVHSQVAHVSEELSEFGRLRKTREYFSYPENQLQIRQAFLQYRHALRRIGEFTESEMSIIQEVNENLNKNGLFGLVRELGFEGCVEIVEIINEMMDENSPVYQQALQELHGMMTNGQALTDEGLKPQDGDSRSDSAIWGFTQIDPKHIETQMHFVMCHFLERLIGQVLRQRDVEFAFHKDFLLNAMTDLFIIQWTKHHRFQKIFDIWHRSKAEGGLGWISHQQMLGYASIEWEKNISPTGMLEVTEKLIQRNRGNEETYPEEFVQQAYASLIKNEQIKKEEKESWVPRALIYNLCSPLFTSRKDIFREQRAVFLMHYGGEKNVRWFQDERSGDILLFFRKSSPQAVS